MKNLTEGRPLKIIIGISVPIFISYIVQQMYNMADTVIVGQMLGAEALAAVGATANIYNFMLSIVMGMTQGFAVIAANRFGEGSQEAVKSVIFHSVLLTGAISVILTLPAVIVLKDFLRIMNTPEAILPEAYQYIKIIILGLLITSMLNLLYAMIRSLGDAKTPLYFLIASSLLNVVLDICFVKFTGKGAAAVACATVLSQIFALAGCAVYAWKYIKVFRIRVSERRIEPKTTAVLLRIGIPMALQGAVTQIGFLALQSSVNRFGVDVIAGYTAGSRLEQLCLQPLNTFGTAMAVYTGQNYGAKNRERIRQGVKVSVLMAVITSIFLGVILRVFGEHLLTLFIEESDEAVIMYGSQYVNTFSVFLTGVALIFLFRNVIQGMANAAIPMAVGFLEFAVRMIWVFALNDSGSYAALCFVNPVTWAAAAIPLVIGYLIIMSPHRTEDTHGRKA